MTIFKNDDLELNEQIQEQLINKQCIPQLNYKERMSGFVICLILGVMIQVMSFGSSLGILIGNPNKFAITFTFGNIVQLLGSFFLIGPKQQIFQMLSKSRFPYTFFYLLSLLLTIFSILAHMNFIIVILCIIFQSFSYIFYIFSYIPNGTNCLRSLIATCLRKNQPVS